MVKALDAEAVQWREALRRHAEQALREREATLNAITSCARDAIIMMDDQGKVVFWNAAASRILGWDESAAIGRDVHSMLAPEHYHIASQKGLADFFRTGQGPALDKTLELQARRQDQTEIPIELSLSAVQHGGKWHAVGILRELSERKRSEEALRESEEKYRRIVDTANEGIWMLDEDFRITFANRRMMEMLDFTAAEMVGQSVVAFLFEEDLPAFAARAEVRRRGLPQRFESRLRRKDGEAVWSLVSATSLLDGDGLFRGSFAMSTDITELKRAETALRELSGRLLRLQDEERRRVARDLHDHAAQWLAALAMNLTALKSLAPMPNAQAPKLLDESLSLLERCSREVRTLSYLLHPPLLEELGLAGAIEEYADEFSKRSGIRVQVELDPGFGRLPGNTELALFRILQESLMNVHRHSGSLTANVRLRQAGAEVRLEVSDAGHGMGLPGTRPIVGNDWPQRFGVGITGMRERLWQLGGRLAISRARTAPPSGPRAAAHQGDS